MQISQVTTILMILKVSFVILFDDNFKNET